jgi:hypothetical protein
MTEPQGQFAGGERSRFLVALVAGAAIVVLLGAGLMLLTHSLQPRGPAAAGKLPFGAEEQAYAEQIHFQDIEMSRATNFLNQEFTYVTGTISNDGARTLAGLEITLEFHDPFNQVILRESQRAIGPAARPLAGGGRRAFQVTFEHIPSEWNQQYPSIRITGLAFE